jgi:FdhD protein
VRKANVTRQEVEQVSVQGGVVRRRVRRDTLATEEPLEIRVVPAPAQGAATADARHPVAVTMRTPGADFELAMGFLFAEGVVDHPDQVAAIRYCVGEGREQQFNIVNVFLAPGTPFDPAASQRNFYVTSSCGVCGKASIEAVRELGCPRVTGSVRVDVAGLLRMPPALRQSQRVFERTGGLHAAALFTAGGELVRVREDVGRHNAMDKLVGAALLGGKPMLEEGVVLVSGRVSFELVQKAARAGVVVLAGVSAPSSLAVELARDVGLTLIGFLREERFNVYAGAERLLRAGAVPATMPG